jgi:DNA-directed RNA polymerase subunit RPC12/RpoP
LKLKKTYLVVACSKCRALLLARQGRKTRQCPYCGTKMNLMKTEVLWVTSDVEEARSILRSKRQGRSEPVRASEYQNQIGTGF